MSNEMIFWFWIPAVYLTGLFLWIVGAIIVKGYGEAEKYIWSNWVYLSPILLLLSPIWLAWAVLIFSLKQVARALVWVDKNFLLAAYLTLLITALFKGPQ